MGVTVVVERGVKAGERGGRGSLATGSSGLTVFGDKGSEVEGQVGTRGRVGLGQMAIESVDAGGAVTVAGGDLKTASTRAGTILV